MRDINDYTGMTRAEFLKIANKEDECPNYYGLHCIERICRDNIQCKQCWEQAVKNIKFKGDNMEKKDLKNGMVVELRNKERYIILDNYIINNENWDCLNDYKNDDLSCLYDGEMDIMKVYNICYGNFKEILANAHLAGIVWQRSEVDWSKVEVDTKVILYTESGVEIKAYFAYYKFDKVYTWGNGKTSFSTDTDNKNNVRVTSLEHVRLYKEE